MGLMTQQSVAFEAAFSVFNNKLFNRELPPCMLVLSRNADFIGGYFSPNRWEHERDDGEIRVFHEIAMNVNLMEQRELVDFYVSLAHEMVHLWQEEFGEVTKGEMHNREWSDKAKEIGLIPVNLENPDQDTGFAVKTTLADGGPLERAIRNLPESAILPLSARPLHIPDGTASGGVGQGGGTATAKPNPEPTPKPRPKHGRCKYTCPVCGMNAWAKPGLRLMCGKDSTMLVEQVI